MQTLTTQAELDAFCTRAQGHPYVTIDTEFLRERTYYSKLCLLQMAVPGDGEADAVLVDPLSSEMSLEPLTDYSRFKADCERILNEAATSDFVPVTIRPATVCGYSPRQRLDVVVNILTNLAYHKGEITVFGGQQLRPNIHITDMVESYITVLNAEDRLVSGQIFNAGYENQPVRELAETVRDVVGDHVQLRTTPTDDNRSYHISSEKIKRELGFEARHTIREAAQDLVQAFQAGDLPDSLDSEIYFNIRRMQSLKLV